MITPFDADDDDEEEEEQGKVETAAAKTGQGKGEIPAQPDQSLNEVLSTELQRDFASRIAMESQLGDTLKSRLITVFLHFSYGIHFLFFFFYHIGCAYRMLRQRTLATIRASRRRPAAPVSWFMWLMVSSLAVHMQSTSSSHTVHNQLTCINSTYFVHTISDNYIYIRRSRYDPHTIHMRSTCDPHAILIWHDLHVFHI